MERNPAHGLLRNIYRGYLERLDRPGWKKFASSLVALGVAFLLAIFSRIFREDGRLIPTAVSAILALLLSGYVALTAVPYLARRSSLGWFRVRIDYKLTREGIAFIALIFVLAIAGLNTGNNLLYMVLASLLAAILMSGFLSMAVLTGVALEVMLPDHVFARRPVPARITLRNQKKLIPSFSITLTGGDDPEKKKKRKRKRSSPEPGGAASQPASTDGPGRKILGRPIYFSFLPAARAVTQPVELSFPQRGLYREKGFSLSTRFPFGFLEKKLRLPVSRDLWVYPAVEPTEEFYEILPMLSGEIEAFERGRGHDLYGIRDMLSTDSARHVDWKASARTGVLKVREFSREDERRLQLIFDRRIGPLDETALRQFEVAVEFCACLAWHFHEVDAQLQFLCGDFQTPAARAEDIIYDILGYLAAVEPSAEAPQALPPVESGENVFRIVCTAAPRGLVPTEMWSRSYFIFFDALRQGPPGQDLLRAETGNR
ncbi:MAG: DUF58 domain-containing protein [Acidobacteria bacterium]|nr:DUF58 domain-containing protein [Acidobacteriota bacterium]